MKIGQKIKQRRLALDLTLEQLGEMVGVGKSTVRKWETGDIKNMRRDKIALLANALDMSPSELVNENEQPEISSEQQMKAKIHQLVDSLSPADIQRAEAVLQALLATQEKQPPVQD